MITPENQIPFDDTQNDEAEDNQSQKDIHSNGIEQTEQPNEEQTDTNMLKQAYDASEPSYTLPLDEN